MQDLVSVIIPAYNAEKYLAEAVGSVLAQSHRPLEVIIVDDGSTDRTKAVAASFGSAVNYSWQAHAGAAAARNTGVRMAQGGFIAFLDADDLWEPCKLALQVHAFRQDPTLSMVFGHVQQFVSPELSTEEAARLNYQRGPLPGRSPSALLMRTIAFRQIGEFDVQWKLGEFVDWHCRAQESGLKELMLPEVVCRRRLHRTNQGLVNKAERREYIEIIRHALARRRRGAAGGSFSQ
jgi:glycosyltransferase involved in cell wall biosynthesis